MYGLPPPAFRLPDPTHVGGVGLQVSNLPQSVEYYEDVLGLRASRETADTTTLHAADDKRPLVTLHTHPGVTRARRGAFGLYHFALLLPDRPALGRFADHVAGLGIRAGMADHLVSEALYLWDPDGLGIEVYADRPRSAWQHHGAELAMTTDTLDVADVIASAGGKEWDGAPSGTRMGHVHLHVGSLRDAEAFYHRALGFDKTVWSYPGALFMSAGGYHHHLAANVWSPGPSPTSDHAQLLEWQLVLPSHSDVAAAGHSLRANEYATEEHDGSIVAPDPWGTRVRIQAHA